MNGDDQQDRKDFIRFLEDHLTLDEQTELSAILKSNPSSIEFPGLSNKAHEIIQKASQRFGEQKALAKGWEDTKDAFAQADTVKKYYDENRLLGFVPEHFSNKSNYDNFRALAESQVAEAGRMAKQADKEARTKLDWLQTATYLGSKAAGFVPNIALSMLGTEMHPGVPKKDWETIKGQRRREKIKAAGYDPPSATLAGMTRGFGGGVIDLAEMLPGFLATSGISAATKGPLAVRKLAEVFAKKFLKKKALGAGTLATIESAITASMGGSSHEAVRQIFSKGLGTEYMKDYTGNERPLDLEQMALSGATLGGAAALKGLARAGVAKLMRGTPSESIKPGTRRALKFAEETPVAGAFAGLEYAQTGDPYAALASGLAYQAVGGGFPEMVMRKPPIEYRDKAPFRIPLASGKMIKETEKKLSFTDELSKHLGTELTESAVMPILFSQEPMKLEAVQKGATEVIKKALGIKAKPGPALKAMKEKRNVLMSVLSKLSEKHDVEITNDQMKAMMNAVDYHVGSKSMRMVEASEELKEGKGNVPSMWASIDFVRNMMDGPSGDVWRTGMNWVLRGTTKYYTVKDVYQGKDINSKYIFSPTQSVGNPERTVTSGPVRMKVAAELRSRAETMTMLDIFLKKHQIQKFSEDQRMDIARWLDGLRTETMKVSGAKLREPGTQDKIDRFFKDKEKEYGKAWGKCAKDLRRVLDNHRKRKAEITGLKEEDFGYNNYYPHQMDWLVRGGKKQSHTEMLNMANMGGVRLAPYYDIKAAKKWFFDKSMAPRMAQDPRYNLDPLVLLTEHMPSVISYLNHAPVEKRIRNSIYGTYRKIRIRDKTEEKDIIRAKDMLGDVSVGSANSTTINSPNQIIRINGKNFYRFMGSDEYLDKSIKLYDGTFDKRGSLVEAYPDMPITGKIGLEKQDTPKTLSERRQFLEKVTVNEGRETAAVASNFLKAGIDVKSAKRDLDGDIMLNVGSLTENNVTLLKKRPGLTLVGKAKEGKLYGEVTITIPEQRVAEVPRKELANSYNGPAESDFLYLRREGDLYAPVYRVPLTKDNIRQMTIRQDGLRAVPNHPNVWKTAERWIKRNLDKEDIRNLQDCERMLLKVTDGFVGWTYFTTLGEFNTKAPLTNLFGGQIANFRTLGATWYKAGLSGMTNPNKAKEKYPYVYDLIYKKLMIAQSGKKQEIERLDYNVVKPYLTQEMQTWLKKYPKAVLDTSFMFFNATENINRLPAAWGGAIRAIEGYGFRYNEKISLKQNIAQAYRVGETFGNNDLIKKLNPAGRPESQRKIIDKIYEDAVEQEIIGAVGISQNIYQASSPDVFTHAELRPLTQLQQWNVRYLDRFFYEDMKELFKGRPGKMVRNAIGYGLVQYTLGAILGQDMSTIGSEGIGKQYPFSEIGAIQAGKPLGWMRHIPLGFQPLYGPPPAIDLALSVAAGLGAVANTGGTGGEILESVRKKRKDNWVGIGFGRTLKILYDLYRMEESHDPEKPYMMKYAFSDKSSRMTTMMDFIKYATLPGRPKTWSLSDELTKTAWMDGQSNMIMKMREHAYELKREGKIEELNRFLKGMREAGTPIVLTPADERRMDKEREQSPKMRKISSMYIRDKINFVLRGMEVHTTKELIDMYNHIIRSPRTVELMDTDHEKMRKIEDEIMRRIKNK